MKNCLYLWKMDYFRLLHLYIQFFIEKIYGIYTFYMECEMGI